jgi:hypothetical protein
LVNWQAGSVPADTVIAVGVPTVGVIVTPYCAVVTAHEVAVIVSVTCTHPAPAAPQVTVMELPVVDPTIIPPDIAQL